MKKIILRDEDGDIYKFKNCEELLQSLSDVIKMDYYDGIEWIGDNYNG